MSDDRTEGLGPGIVLPRRIETRALTKLFRVAGGETVVALNGLDASFSSGGIHLLWGPSGSGKTTLLSILGGMDRPTRGEVLVDGRSLESRSDLELALHRRREIGFLFQRSAMLPRLPVWANVSLSFIPDGIGVWERREIAFYWLSEFGLAGRLDHLPEQLSGGELQRACLARALLRDPPILLIDEPTSQIDAANSEKVLSILDRMAQTGRLVIVASHDPSVRALARWTTCLEARSSET